MSKRIVVFDMDGTLGYFSQLSILFKSIEMFLNKRISQKCFNEIMNLYNECLRPDICEIFSYLIEQREHGKIDRICIYTNNKGPKLWTSRIKRYFEEICPGLVFDNVICAFTVNGEIIEEMRTTNNKTYNDLVKCTKMPKDTQVCFIDDQIHKYMEHENVYYIHVKPYVYSLTLNELFGRFIHSSILKYDKPLFINYLNAMFLKKIKYNHEKKEREEIDIDKIASKQMLKLISEF
uniref:FCP1 homology domain-containing protein n=1 Tax=viral metagenome TaxID=1070528 RepID=A0A6C0BTX8_9ZZZZ